ncbi:MAG: lytic murein transglycosylase [Candidatus Cloacimonadota bacterium]|nr:MAG: lytic murein transglycosylase [Candidatus Cloacimonadota bacterium]
MKRIFKFFVFIVLAFLILFFNPVSARIITLAAAHYYGLNAHYFYRMIRAESSFMPWAKSKRNAYGLGQIQPRTARYMEPDCRTFYLWFPITNLRISAKYVNYLLKKYNGNMSVALAAYNWGETNVDRKVKNMTLQKNKNYIELFNDIPETRNFINKIMNEKSD